MHRVLRHFALARFGSRGYWKDWVSFFDEQLALGTSCTVTAGAETRTLRHQRTGPIPQKQARSHVGFKRPFSWRLQTTPNELTKTAAGAIELFLCHCFPLGLAGSNVDGRPRGKQKDKSVCAGSKANRTDGGYSCNTPSPLEHLAQAQSDVASGLAKKFRGSSQPPLLRLATHLLRPF